MIISIDDQIQKALSYPPPNWIPEGPDIDLSGSICGGLVVSPCRDRNPFEVPEDFTFGSYPIVSPNPTTSPVNPIPIVGVIPLILVGLIAWRMVYPVKWKREG